MRILITGVSTRALAESARAAGYEFVTLDYFGDYDQKSWCENYSLKRDFDQAYGPGRLYEASRRLHYDALVYVASLENHPRIVALLAGIAEDEEARAHSTRPLLLGNSPQALSGVRDGPALLEFLRQQGVPAPRTLRPGETVPPDPTTRWLRKPVASGGGHEIAFWPGGKAPGAEFTLQEYVDGRPCSAAFAANGREASLLGLSEQLIGRREFGAAPFAYCGNIFPLPPGTDGAPDQVLAEVKALIRAITRAYGLTGLNGLDFVLHDGRVVPLEVNPRYTASMELMELAGAASMFDCQVQSVLEGRLPANWEGIRAGTYLGKAILYAEHDCRAPDTRDWVARGIRDVPFPGEEIAQGSPICTILGEGVTPGACYTILVSRAEELKGELYA